MSSSRRFPDQELQAHGRLQPEVKSVWLRIGAENVKKHR